MNITTFQKVSLIFFSLPIQSLNLFKAGEDTVLYCSNCEYSANTERAEGKVIVAPLSIDGDSVVYNTSEFLGIIKKLGLSISVSKSPACGAEQTSIFIIPMNRCWNDNRLTKLSQKESFPVDKYELKTSNVQHVDNWVLDNSVAELEKFITRLSDYDVEKSSIHIGPYVEAKEGDACPKCNTENNNHILKASKAIEVGHTFYLGQKYSKALSAKIQSRKNAKVYVEMGCYGIGVSRLIAAIAETNRDQHGLVWPENVTPFKYILIPAGKIDSAIIDYIYKKMTLVKGEDQVLLDDRTDSFGSKIKDAECFGYPFICIIGKTTTIENGQIEIIDRKTMKKNIRSWQSL